MPGGFAYGDYLRCGAMAAHSPIMREVKARAARGTPVLGICNGFQVLTEAGLLPGALLANRTLKFHLPATSICASRTAQTIFTCGYEAGQVIRVPVAHHDGNYFADADDARPARRRRPRRVPLLRAGRRARPTTAMPTARRAPSPASSTRPSTVLGLMPHPEDATDPLLGGTDGRALLRRAWCEALVVSASATSPGRSSPQHRPHRRGISRARVAIIGPRRRTSPSSASSR